jgi:hypothetical protein
LIARRVGHVHRVMYASPSYIARRGQPRTPRDLAKHEIVCVSHPPRPRNGAFASRAGSRSCASRRASWSPKWTPCCPPSEPEPASPGHCRIRSRTTLPRGQACASCGTSSLHPCRSSRRPDRAAYARAVRAFLDHAAPALDALRVIHE